MADLKDLYTLISKENITITSWDIGQFKAATIKQESEYCIYINRNIINTASEEKCVIAHEIGHCMTGATHVLSSSHDLIEKHEYKANKYAVMKLITRNQLKKAIKKGHTEVWDIAEYFGVTEDFIIKALFIYNLN